MRLAEAINIIYDPLRNRYKGVYPSLDKWQAIIQSKSICKYLGRFETPQLAAECVVQWYIDNYGPMWEQVISRNKYGKQIRVPWDVTSHITKDRYGSFTGWKATVWVSSKAINVIPDMLELDCDEETFYNGYWLDEAYAWNVCHQFVDRFRERKVERHILFRC